MKKVILAFAFMFVVGGLAQRSNAQVMRPTSLMGAGAFSVERHDDCVGASNGSLGSVGLRNNCRAQVDLKWCYMREDGGDVSCRISAPLNPGFEINTPQCYQCAYKVTWEVFFTSDRARNEFSSDEQMIARLR